MTGEILAARLVGAEEHNPPAGAHFVLLAGLVVIGLVIFGVSWWRRRRGSGAGEQRSTSRDLSGESTRSKEKK